MPNLKQELIRLGNVRPDLRPHLKPLLDKLASGRLEDAVKQINQETGRQLTVFEKADSRGAIIKILEGRNEVGFLSAADVRISTRELDEIWMEHARAGKPRPSRRRASYTRTECLEDFVQLQEKYPAIQKLWAVGYARLDEELRGKGIGKLLYKRLLALGVPHKAAFAPGICFGEETSPSALRVWKSLAREYPSVNYVLWGK